MESAQKVLKWVACSKRPLRLGELREGVAFQATDKNWDSDKIPDEDTLLRSCRGLVVRDDVEETIRFAHHTVRQYLVLDEKLTDKQALLAMVEGGDEHILAQALDITPVNRRIS